MNLFLTIGFMALALVLAMAYAQIVQRHAIPKAPVIFHLLLSAPCILAVADCLILAMMTGVEATSLLGLGLVCYRALLVWFLVLVFGILVYYGYWYQMHGEDS